MLEIGNIRDHLQPVIKGSLSDPILLRRQGGAVESHLKGHSHIRQLMQQGCVRERLYADLIEAEMSRDYRGVIRRSMAMLDQTVIPLRENLGNCGDQPIDIGMVSFLQTIILLRDLMMMLCSHVMLHRALHR